MSRPFDARHDKLRPLERGEQVIALGAIMAASIAATVFIVVLVLGADGATEVGRVFSPIAVAATLVALVFGVLAVIRSRIRAVGVATVIVVVPCLFLSLLSIVGMTS